MAEQPTPTGYIPIAPQPAPVPPDEGAAFQPWEAIPDNRALERYTTLEAAKGNSAYVWNAAQSPELQVLFNPKDAPVRGMFSALVPSALEVGMYPLIQNLRYSDGALTARQPTVDRSVTGLPSGSSRARGLWCGNLNGTQYIVAACYDGSKVGLYVSTNGTSFSAITASSGAYGDTRMTDTSVPVSFCVVNDPVDGKDYLVVQNGTDSPRVYSPTAANSQYVRIHSAITAPSSLSSYSPTISAPCYANLTTGVTATPTGATFSGLAYTADFTNGPSFVKWTFGNQTAADTGLIQFTAVDWSSATQMCLAFGMNQSGSFNFLLSQFKVEIYDGVGGYQTVYDPTSGSNAYNWVETTTQAGVSSWKYLSLFTFDVSALTRTSVSRIRLTAKYTSTYTSMNVWLAAIFGGIATGAWYLSDQSTLVTSSSSYLVTYMNSGSRAESAGVVISPPTGGSKPLWTTLGSNDWSNYTSSYGSVYLPINTKVRFSLRIPFVNCSTSDRDAGVDTINIYRQDPGGNLYYFATSASMATWGGATWAYVNTGGTGVYYTSDATGPNGLTVSRVAPDAYSITMPAGTAMVVANGRSFVGSGSATYVSEYQAPWRHRSFLAWSGGQPVERSATKITFSGEQMVGYASASSSALGSSTVFAFTDRQTYSIAGFDGYSLSRPNTLATVGCSARGSIQSYKDVIFFLDNQGQIRRFTYGHSAAAAYANANAWELMRPISRQVVDDRTTAIPTTRLSFVTSAIFKDRYYLAHTPSGGSENTRILVWDETVGGFVEDTVTSIVGLATSTLAATRILLGQGSDTKVYTHEDQTSSTTVSVALTWPELHNKFWSPMFYGRFGIVCDVQSGQTATITKTCKPNQTDSTTIDLSTSATNQVWRWDNRSGAPGGQRGVSCQIALTMTMTPGTRLYSVVVEATPASPGADV